MTPKEALKGIKQAIAEHLHLKTGVSVEKHFEYLQYDTEIDIVEQALTELEELKRYPTADEVCEALSEYYHYEVEYSKRDMTFESELSWYACFKDGVIDFGGDKLPPHLITLIGRFYEGVEKK
jgi:hypothetical protein